MKILVTGGAGFIGSNFIHFWMKKFPQDTINNLDKLTYAGNPDNLLSVAGDPNYRFIEGDICNRALVDSIVRDTDWIVHFAAESHVDRSIMSPDSFVETNVKGTYVLLQSALKFRIKKFHHISTDEVFGSLPLDSKEKFHEKTSYDPRSPYAASKASSDHLVRSFFHTYGLPVTITNCSNNYGPYQHPEKLIPLTITNLLEGKRVPVYGRGDNVRDWLMVNDHCRAIELVLRYGKTGETYCVGGMTRDVPNIRVVKMIIRMLGKNESSIYMVKDRPGHDKKYAIDWSKIKRDLGWEPEHDFISGLEYTVKWYRNNMNWWRKLKNSSFKKYYRKNYRPQ